MALQKMYGCDGPDCNEVTPHNKGEKFPKNWIRITAGRNGDTAQSASVHDVGCAHAWLDAIYAQPGPTAEQAHAARDAKL